MNTAAKGRVVNTHNEWAPLEEVIVGTPYHTDYHVDVSFTLFFHDNISDPSNKGVFSRAKPSNRLKDECLEDLEEFVNMLTSRGVTVRRPDVLTTFPQGQDTALVSTVRPCHDVPGPVPGYR